MLGKKWFLHILAIALVLLAVCEARGGGRRGGSMGGIFGSWRKYKKPALSSGSSRRISSSPVHTPITKALNEKKITGSDKFMKNGKGYSKYNTPPLPAGGSYYTNTAAMPGNAIYVAQAPPRGAEFGDFLTGYLTARLMTMSLNPYPYHQHITHVYHDPPNQVDQQANSNSSGKVIVINNNNPLSSTSTSPSIVDTTTTSTASESSSAPYALAYTSSVPPNLDTTSLPPNGIICIPLKVTETNASGDAVQVERIVCYPAPTPTTPIQNEMKSKPVEIAGDIIEH